MNGGPVASRYSKALLKYVSETSAAGQVYAQVCAILRMSEHLMDFREAVSRNTDISIGDKIGLMETAVGGPMAPELERFIRLIDSMGRMTYLPRILVSFVERYRRAHNIKTGQLTMARSQAGVLEDFRERLCRKTGAEVVLTERTDESLVGGFILEFDGFMMDASVKEKLRRIREGLIENNNRLI